MMARPVPSPEDAAYADRRATPRVPVALPALLQANEQRHFVRLLDVSAGGAKLHCAAAIAVGTEVMLDCGVLGRAAVVRWRNGDMLGLCFKSELASRDVAALMARSEALAARMNAGE